MKITIAPPQLDPRLTEDMPFAAIAADADIEDAEAYRFCRETVAEFAPRTLTVGGCVFDRVRLASLRMRGVRFHDVRFERCDLSMADLRGTSFNRVEFVGCKLQGADMSESTMNHVSFADTSARYVNVAASRLRHVRFAGSDLRGGVLADMKTEAVEVSRCDFTEADFSHTRLAGFDLRDSTIDGIAVNLPDLRGVTVSTWQAAALIRILGVRVED